MARYAQIAREAWRTECTERTERTERNDRITQLQTGRAHVRAQLSATAQGL
jgi:hypothetical protein